MLIATVERMAQGNLSTSMPHVPKSLEPLASAVNALRKNVISEIELLNERQELLDATLNGLADSVLLFTGDRLTFYNRTAADTFGLHDFHLDTPLEKLPIPKSVSWLIRRMIAATTPQVADSEPDPNQHSFRVRSTQLGAARAASKATLLTIEDTTERARIDRVRKDFVTAASHELKTPVSAMALLSDAALMAAEDNNMADVLDFVTQLQGEARNLQRLVVDLLDLSRLETRFAPDEFADVRVAVKNTIMTHRFVAEAKGLTIEVDDSAAGSEDLFVLVSPTDMTIILDNLFDNAVAYTDRGGITITLETTGKNVVISVTDTGIGIAPDQVDRVFERFYRVDPSRSKESGGTGLGLALVKHAVVEAGGTVRLGSMPGHGTTATVTLPRAR